MATSKTCSMCKAEKPLDEFHRQPRGQHGRHSWCKACYNAKHSKRKVSPSRRREHNYKRRYGMTTADVAAMLAAQNGRCAICETDFETNKFHVDHDHADGRVRGLLCHRCNIHLPFAEDSNWLRRAHSYLRRERVQ